MAWLPGKAPWRQPLQGQRSLKRRERRQDARLASAVGWWGAERNVGGREKRRRHTVGPAPAYLCFPVNRQTFPAPQVFI